MGLTTSTEWQEVDFAKYCKTCKHEKKEGTEDPCNDCLVYAVNHYSSKPVHWEDKNE